MRGTRGILAEVRRSKDPTAFTVLFEDTAAMLGLVAAFAGLLAVQVLGLVRADAAASIAIGAILAVTAMLLAYETKGLLTGEAASGRTVEAIRRMALAEPAVRSVNELRTLHSGADDILTNISLDFEDTAGLEEVERTVTRLEQRIKAGFPAVARIFVEAQAREHHEAIERKQAEAEREP